ncbi:MAG: DUF4476 domain-containing protein [Ferruginibacter sp.]
MKSLLVFLIFIISFASAEAQQYYFAYLQTENRQPFYVKVNDKLYSSSATGYVVVPKLLTGKYLFSIGFPKAEWPQQNLEVNIRDNDEGYLLKDFREKGWGLFNMQSLALIMPENASAVAKTNNTTSTDDGFSNILAGVVNSPGLNEKAESTPASEPVSKPVPSSASTEIPAKSEIKPMLPVPTPLAVKRISSASDAVGSIMVYVDQSNLPADTIRIFIPAETISGSVETQPNSVVTENISAVTPSMPVDTTVVVNPEININTQEEIPLKSQEIIVQSEPMSVAKKEGDPNFMGMELPNPNAGNKPEDIKVDSTKTLLPETIPLNTTTEVEMSVKPAPKAVPIPNSDCKSVASDDDFLKLRKKMASGDNDDDMISIARKVYKSKCFTTEQVKNLGVLFLTDEARYHFFDASYPFAYDSYNYPTLEDQLLDTYYINRFRAMVTH